jgi:site-specific DNA-cytosine methylase
MRVLDLFSGLGGWSQAFKERGHEIICVDNESKFKPDICADIMFLSDNDFRKYGKIDIILASPPCNNFSVASVYRHWDKDTGMPKDQKTIDSIKLVAHTLELIVSLMPYFWVLENPRGMMRRVLGLPQKTTYFASWATLNEFFKIKAAWLGIGTHFSGLKPTDIWGHLPPSIIWREPVVWDKAARGSKTGTQGKINAAERAKIPYGLSLEMCLACERDLAKYSKS